ncbi:hypothetical protein [Streptomyces collinus]|nr:hypothetical protein [Streptomyces collinus]UJA08267.1 hypothetical protein HGI10_21770 [Streptomyces collinus]UJA16868.1 hypothetical protein HGI09_42340 [Streptomyces collinus]
MTAEHEGADGADGAEAAREYAGMDALMAAITGAPLPEEARRDPAFLAEHRAAEADMALLRSQLTRLADALTGEPPADRPAPRADRTPPHRKPTAPAGEADDDTTAPAGQAGDGATAPAGEAYDEVDVRAMAPARDADVGIAAAAGGGRGASSSSSGEADVTAPAAPVRSGRRSWGGARPGGSARPGRPRGPRRVLRIALGSVAGVAALGMVAGLGLLVARTGGSAGDAKSSAADGAKSAGQAPAKVSGDAGRPAAPARVLACYKLVVEGTVAAVEPRAGSPWTRIELTVRQAYEPARTAARVAFDLDAGARPAPRAGQHVLVGVGRGQTSASLWAVGDARVAVNRAWITEALPEARHTGCPSGREAPTGKP